MPQLKESLTDRQRAVFDYIRDTIQKRGSGPTVREIGEHFRIGSPNAVMAHLRTLEKKGLLQRVRKQHPARGVSIELATDVIEESDLQKSLEALAGELFEDGEKWLQTPHPMLGGESPRELIRQLPESEKMVRAILQGIKYGFSP